MLTAHNVQFYAKRRETNMDMTIREISDTFGVSRRAIQGYEKAGLLSSVSGKNNHGHLLYDEAVQEQIKRIEFFILYPIFHDMN